MSCSVCESAIETGSASSRCSNRDCITRDRDNDLTAASNASDVYEYYKNRDVVSEDDIIERLQSEYRQYKNNTNMIERTELNGRIEALRLLLGWSWGDVKAAYEEDNW